MCSRIKLALLALLWPTVMMEAAHSRLTDLQISVMLQRDGSARITEERQMLILDEGTELYIALQNLNGSVVSDLEVNDETGAEFENIGEWDVDRSREWKTRKCGIVTTAKGYELCWGLGEPGQRTYTTRYNVTQLVDGYNDADGMLWMFVNPGLNPKPNHVKVTISAPDTLRFTEANTRIWAFRFAGHITLQDGSIVAESDDYSFDERSAVVVMAQFEKGLFLPEAAVDGSFEEVKQRAFDGSDYTFDDDDDDDIGLWALLVAAATSVFGLIWYVVYVWIARRKVNKHLQWYRDIPMEGDLQRANKVLNAYRYFTSDYNNLLSACILKLIDIGAIRLTTHQTKEGKTTQDFEICTLPNPKSQPILLRKVFEIFANAAGDDSILEPRELKQYMRASYSRRITDTFLDTLHARVSIGDLKETHEEVCQLFGLKKFLKEFTLLDERGLNEVALWKDYIIYATLFGIAEQVIKDMKRINPEFFKMDEVASQMADDMTLPMIYSTLHRGTARAAADKANREAQAARASGGGGSSSIGGGGGFSGGGFGGGVR